MRIDFEIQSVTTRAGGGMGLSQDRLPGPWSEEPKVRGVPITNPCPCVPDVVSISGHISGCYTCEGADEVCIDESHSTDFDNIPDEFFSIGIDSDDGNGNCVFYLKQAGESNWLEFSFAIHVVFTQNSDGTGSVTFTSNPCGVDGGDTIFTVDRDAPDGIRGDYSVDFTGVGGLIYHFDISIPTTC